MKNKKNNKDTVKIERVTLWALLGILVTVLIGVPSLYLSFREKNAHISYQMTSESNVLDIHKPIKDLEIKYRGEDIQNQRKNLKILRLLIKNDGKVDIRQGDFDQTMPWGVKITNGQIVETPKIIETNSKYIGENLKPTISTDNLINFQKIIFETDKYFMLEMQVLQPVDTELLLEVVGKITGIETQNVVRTIKLEAGPSFLLSVFYGSISVQVARIFIFAIGLIILVFVLVGGIIKIDERLEPHKAKRTITKLDNFLHPILLGKNEDAQRLLKLLFLRSRGYLHNLEEAKENLLSTDGLEGLELIFQGMSKLKKGVPYVFRSYIYDPDKRDLFTFITEQREGGIRIKPDVKKALVELFDYLTKNEVPSKLHKRLYSWDLEKMIEGERST